MMMNERSHRGNVKESKNNVSMKEGEEYCSNPLKFRLLI
jgi:hypothetical protein